MIRNLLLGFGALGAAVTVSLVARLAQLTSANRMDRTCSRPEPDITEPTRRATNRPNPPGND